MVLKSLSLKSEVVHSSKWPVIALLRLDNSYPSQFDFEQLPSALTQPLVSPLLIRNTVPAGILDALDASVAVEALKFPMACWHKFTVGWFGVWQDDVFSFVAKKIVPKWTASILAIVFVALIVPEQQVSPNRRD